MTKDPASGAEQPTFSQVLDPQEWERRVADARARREKALAERKQRKEEITPKGDLASREGARVIELDAAKPPLPGETAAPGTPDAAPQGPATATPAAAPSAPSLADRLRIVTQTARNQAKSIPTDDAPAPPSAAQRPSAAPRPGPSRPGPSRPAALKPAAAAQPAADPQAHPVPRMPAILERGRGAHAREETAPDSLRDRADAAPQPAQGSRRRKVPLVRVLAGGAAVAAIVAALAVAIGNNPAPAPDIPDSAVAASPEGEASWIVGLWNNLRELAPGGSPPDIPVAGTPVTPPAQGGSAALQQPADPAEATTAVPDDIFAPKPVANATPPTAPDLPDAATPSPADPPRTAVTETARPQTFTPQRPGTPEIDAATDIAAPETLPLSLQPGQPAADETTDVAEEDATRPLPPSEMRVYIHAPASVPQDRIDAAQAALSAAGFPVQSVIRVNVSVSASNVRYFHGGDSENAASIGSAITGLLPTGADVRDFTYLDTQAQPGLIEIWLAGEPRRVTPTRLTAQPAAPTQAPEPVGTTIPVRTLPAPPQAQSAEQPPALAPPSAVDPNRLRNLVETAREP